jgi:hypothetical protein
VLFALESKLLCFRQESTAGGSRGDRKHVYAILKKMKKYQHQHDINGCGLACLANLLDKDYLILKKDFEKKFYSVKWGIAVSDMAKYLATRGHNYTVKFFSEKNYNARAANKCSRIEHSITLIAKNKKYPLGHYLLRTKDGWIDPWYNVPCIDNVHAKLRKRLPNHPHYVIYPSNFDYIDKSISSKRSLRSPSPR